MGNGGEAIVGEPQGPATATATLLCTWLIYGHEPRRQLDVYPEMTLRKIAPVCASDRWIRWFDQVNDAHVRLLCFPHAGGAATYFLPLSNILSPAIQVLGIQYPGRQERRNEKCIEAIPELADLIVDQLDVVTDEAFALFGHSMGAVIAFEVTRRLEAQGRLPMALFVSGRRAPSCNRLEATYFLNDRALVAELKSLSSMNSRILEDEEVMQSFLPAIRSDYKAIETYRCNPDQSPISTPIYAHFGHDDPKVTGEEARRWAEHTSGGFEAVTYPGGHFYLENHIAQLATNIRECITRKI